MNTKKRGLGRGLDALLGSPRLESAPESLQKLPIELLRPGRFQPRKDIDPSKLRELADSISAQGVVQPIVVRRLDQSYEIIAGERRWRAAQLAGLSDIPVVIREVSDQTAMAISLIENIQREDLNPLEEAEALKRLLEEFQMTHQQVADAVGRSRVTVSNLLRLNDLHPEVKALLLKGEIEMGHARAILGLEAVQQVELAKKIAARKLSVRAAELLVRRLQEGQATARKKAIDPDVRSLEERISEKLGTPVQIRPGRQGAGQLIISYGSLDQLEGVLERIQ